MVFYTFCPFCYPSGVEKEPPLCKGRWLAKQDGGIVKSKIPPQKQSLSRLRRQLPLHKGAFFTFTYDLSIFLTSTAFVDTNAKIRHTSFEIYRILSKLSFRELLKTETLRKEVVSVFLYKKKMTLST